MINCHSIAYCTWRIAVPYRVSSHCGLWSPSQLCDSHYISSKLFILKNYMRCMVNQWVNVLTVYFNPLDWVNPKYL